MVTHAIDTYGRLDYVVNNAGIEGNFAPIVDLPDDEWDRVLDINLKGAFLCMKHESRAMLETGRRGAIVNVGSVNSFLGDAIFYPAVLPGVHLQRAGQPEEIAQAIVFLCSDAASYITGSTLTPDGGFMLPL